jgi:AcrR family transcriptional regulator
VDQLTGRANQKARTRKAIVEACRDLTRSGGEMTMLGVARAAMVSEATAYRYFPDLVSLLREVLTGLWPDPAQAMEPVSGSADPAERVAFACQYLLRGVVAYQGSVRAMISHTIAAPAGRDGAPPAARARPGIRFGLIDHALAPFEQGATAGPGPAAGTLAPEAMARLKLGLAVIVSAEALFALTDLCGLSAEDAIGSAAATASALTRAAFSDPGQGSSLTGDTPGGVKPITWP